MMDQEQANAHIDEMHVDRQLQEDLDRMLRERILAASSFVNMQTKDTLTKAVIERRADVIDEWLRQPRPDLRLTLYAKFDEDDALRLGVPVTHIGFAKDTETERIWLCKTNVVAVILQLADRHAHPRQYFTYNAYPYAQEPSDEQRLDIDILPYAQLTDTWRNADAMRKTYIRIMCDHLDRYQVAFDGQSKAIVVSVREEDQDLGCVRLMPEYTNWKLNSERQAILCKYPHMESLMRRAFPETYATIDYVRSLYRKTLHDMDLEQDTPSILQTLPYDIRQAICAMPKPQCEQTPEEPGTSKSEAVDEDVRNRRRRRALSRSKRASKRMGKKRRKAPRKGPSEKAVPTPAKEKGNPDIKADHNDRPAKTPAVTALTPDRPSDTWLARHWISNAMRHNIAIACRETEQALIWTSMLPNDHEPRLAIARMSPRIIDATRRAMERAYPQKVTDDDMNHIHLIDYGSMFAAIERSKAYKTLSDTVASMVIEMIAHDPHWQPLVSDDMLIWMLSNVKAEITQGTMEVLPRTLDTDLPPTDVIAERSYRIPPLMETPDDEKAEVTPANPQRLADEHLLDAISKLSRLNATQTRREGDIPDAKLSTGRFFDASRTIRGL